MSQLASLVAAVTLTAACGSGSIPPRTLDTFVTRVEVRGAGLHVERCDLVFSQEDNSGEQAAMVVLLILLLPFLLAGGGRGFPSNDGPPRHLDVSDCTQNELPLAPYARVAVPGGPS